MAPGLSLSTCVLPAAQKSPRKQAEGRETDTHQLSSFSSILVKEELKKRGSWTEEAGNGGGGSAVGCRVGEAAAAGRQRVEERAVDEPGGRAARRACQAARRRPVEFCLQAYR